MLASILAVGTGGALGAISRFATVNLAQDLLGPRFPYGTLVVNSVGSFLAGFLMTMIMQRFAGNDFWRLFLVVGFLGGFTTFSSFSWETWVLFINGEQLRACLNILLNNGLALGLALLGIQVCRWIGGSV